MTTEWSEKLRQIAERDYVQPARKARTAIRIQQGDLYDRARKLGLPQNHANQVGTSLESRKFWGPRGLEMITPRGQRRERTTIYEYRFREDADQTKSANGLQPSASSAETPEQRAFRVTETLRGIIKDEIASFGGAEAFMRWVRSEDQDAA